MKTRHGLRALLLLALATHACSPGGEKSHTPAESGETLPAQGEAPSLEHCGRLAQELTPSRAAGSRPPFRGTLFVEGGLLTEADPTSFRGLSYAGQARRTMFDRRTKSFDEHAAHLFPARFGSEKVVEVQVNPEFSRAEAEAEAKKYARVIGRLPGFLFRDLDTVWIHRGDELFGGGNRNLLIHTGQGAKYISDGLLEEAFLHEAVHTSVDEDHRDLPLWREARSLDGASISSYAADNPDREDLAETVPLYLALRHWPGRLPASTRATILRTIPNRVAYLDCQGLSVEILP